MKRGLAICVLCLFLATPSLADAVKADVVLRRAPVPAEPPYQGEVRLLRRHSALVMQTILNSKVLRHVVAAIQQKELKRWPEDKTGWVDSRRYTDELFGVFDMIQQRAKGRGETDRYRQLLIEFVLEERRSYVAFYAPTLSREGDQFFVRKKELLKRLKTSRTYLSDNLLAIAQDSFQLEAHEALELMQPIPEKH